MRTKGYRGQDNVTMHVNVVTQLGRPCLAGANIPALGPGGLVVLRCQAGPAIIKHGGSGKSGGSSNSNIYTYHTDLRVVFKIGYPEKQGVYVWATVAKNLKVLRKRSSRTG